ncbi:MAG: hypothetical protein KJ041_04930 [Gammaproteobacteria bacterium]|nr:hypothetical protein [Gammaproteobacteria bacterium]
MHSTCLSTLQIGEQAGHPRPRAGDAVPPGTDRARWERTQDWKGPPAYFSSVM